jgi:AcrR family transcriptional regulator
MSAASGTHTAAGRPLRLPRSARRKQLLAAAQEVFVAQGYHAAAMSSSTDNRQRVAGAMSAYFDFVDQESEAFRLVFESDLRNEPSVRERFERVERGCFEAITETIMADTGFGRERAELLAAGLCGAAEIAARYWLTSGRKVPKLEAEALLAALSWRGIANFPLQGGEIPAS